MRGNTQVAMVLNGDSSFGPGASVSFLAEAVEGSLYTNANVYRLSVGNGAALRIPAALLEPDACRSSPPCPSSLHMHRIAPTA